MTPRIIIVEGPDNCGKSTLAKELATRFNANYWHMTSGPGLCEHGAMELYQRDAFKNALVNLEMGHTTVFDRHWPSDQVYGPILRGIASMEMDYWIEECQANEVVIIFCDRNNAQEEHEKNRDPDHPYGARIYQEVLDGYRDLCELLQSTTNIKIIEYPLDNFMDRDSQLDAFMEGLNKL